jgi:pilus assembly protein Flp/PilA
MKAIFVRWLHEEDGATAVEYGLIAAIICVGVIGSVSSLGDAVQEMWQHILDSYASAQP